MSFSSSVKEGLFKIYYTFDGEEFHIDEVEPPEDDMLKELAAEDYRLHGQYIHREKMKEKKRQDLLWGMAL